MRRFTVNEKALAAGILPGKAMLAQIQRIRADALEAGHDYMTGGSEVFYSAAGAERMAEIVRRAGCAQATGTGNDKEDGASEAQAGTETPPLNRKLMQEVGAVLPKLRVRVVKVFAVNTQYLHARSVDDEEAILTVRVRDNKHFLPEMEMEVVRGIGGTWDYCGRLPRARGRW